MKSKRITQKERDRLFEEHMRQHTKHPNRLYLNAMINRLYYGVALPPEHLSAAHHEILAYLAQDWSLVKPWLNSLKLTDIERNGKIFDSYFTLISDGTVSTAVGEEWRLTENEVKNLWLAVEG